MASNSGVAQKDAYRSYLAMLSDMIVKLETNPPYYVFEVHDGEAVNNSDLVSPIIPQAKKVLDEFDCFLKRAKQAYDAKGKRKKSIAPTASAPPQKPKVAIATKLESDAKDSAKSEISSESSPKVTAPHILSTTSTIVEEPSAAQLEHVDTTTPFSTRPNSDLRPANRPRSYSDLYSTVSVTRATPPKYNPSTQAPEIPPSPLLLQYSDAYQFLQNSQTAASIDSLSVPSSSGYMLPAANDEERSSVEPPQLHHLRSASDPAAGYGYRGKLLRIFAQMEMAANTTILLFRPLTISLQLCLIEHSLFCKIEPAHLLVHKPPQHPSPSIHASTEFFNYLTRLVETSILEPLVPNIRGMVIHTWVKVAWCLLQLRNYQTLKGVVSALGTPPIARLKRTWQCVSKKTMATLKQLKDLVSEQNNYSQYRELMKKNVTRPSVPFLGVVIHDLTYLMALAKKENIGDPTADKRVKEILDQIDYYRKGPRYNLAMLADLELREPPSSVSVNTTASATTSNSPMPGQVSTSSAGSSGKNSRTFRSGEKKMKYGMVQKMLDEYQMVKEFDDESLGAFCAHWILSRRWYTEKEIDEISLLREPRFNNSGASSGLPPPAPQSMQESSSLNTPFLPAQTVGSLSHSTTMSSISNSATGNEKLDISEELPAFDINGACEFLSANKLPMPPDILLASSTLNLSTSWNSPNATGLPPTSPSQPRKVKGGNSIMDALRGMSLGTKKHGQLVRRRSAAAVEGLRNIGSSNSSVSVGSSEGELYSSSPKSSSSLSSETSLHSLEINDLADSTQQRSRHPSSINDRLGNSLCSVNTGFRSMPQLSDSAALESDLSALFAIAERKRELQPKTTESPPPVGKIKAEVRQKLEVLLISSFNTRGKTNSPTANNKRTNATFPSAQASSVTKGEFAGQSSWYGKAWGKQSNVSKGNNPLTQQANVTAENIADLTDIDTLSSTVSLAGPRKPLGAAESLRAVTDSPLSTPFQTISRSQTNTAPDGTLMAQNKAKSISDGIDSVESSLRTADPTEPQQKNGGTEDSENGRVQKSATLRPAKPPKWRRESEGTISKNISGGEFLPLSDKIGLTSRADSNRKRSVPDCEIQVQSKGKPAPNISSLISTGDLSQGGSSRNVSTTPSPLMPLRSGELFSESVASPTKVGSGGQVKKVMGYIFKSIPPDKSLVGTPALPAKQKKSATQSSNSIKSASIEELSRN